MSIKYNLRKFFHFKMLQIRHLKKPKFVIKVQRPFYFLSKLLVYPYRLVIWREEANHRGQKISSDKVGGWNLSPASITEIFSYTGGGGWESEIFSYTGGGGERESTSLWRVRSLQDVKIFLHIFKNFFTGGPWNPFLYLGYVPRQTLNAKIIKTVNCLIN